MYDKKTKVEVFLWTCCTYKLCEHAVHTTSTMSSWRIMQTSWLSALSDCRLPICARSRPASSLFSLSRFVSLRRCVRVSSSVSAICSCSRSPWSFGVSFNRSYAQKHSRRYFFLIDLHLLWLKASATRRRRCPCAPAALVADSISPFHSVICETWRLMNS